MSEMFRRATRDNLDRAIDALARSGAHSNVPLFEAVRAGAIALVYVQARTATLSASELLHMSKPVVVMIGDDDDLATGPAGWACAPSAMGWARGALIHGAAGEPAHYRAAVQGTLAHGRMVLVETASRFITEWAALAAPKPTLIIAPRPGVVHPCRVGAVH